MGSARYGMILAMWVGLWILNGCGLAGPLREDPKAERVIFPTPKGAWTAIHKKTNADFAFQNSQSQAVIAVHSLCERYEHVSLEQLLRQLTNSVTDSETQLTRAIQLDGREGLYRRITGKVDGVPTDSVFVVLRKDHCVFDFALFGSGELRSQDVEAFEAALAGFRYHGSSSRPK